MVSLSREIRLKIHFVTFRLSGTITTQYPATPFCQRAPAYSRIGLGSYPFAHHYLGNHYYFLFLGLLRWFNSPRCLLQPIDSVEDISYEIGCPIWKSPDQSVFTAPRSLSQLATSFFANQCQGIRHIPFIS